MANQGYSLQTTVLAFSRLNSECKSLNEIYMYVGTNG